MVTTFTALRPKASCSGFSAQTRWVVVQFGLVTMKPRSSRARVFWTGMSAVCSGLTSGISSGTSASMRCADAFEQTAKPAAASSSSTAPALPPGSAEKSSRTSDGIAAGSVGTTTMSATAAGMPPRSSHLHASAYRLPTERSEAVSAPISK